MFTERYSVFLSSALILISVNAASSQVVPYITDVFGEDVVWQSDAGGRSDDDRLNLICTFKLFNPDTVPFYIWVSFENGGKLKHSRYGDDSPAIRMVDMELRYRDAFQRQIVKEFPDNSAPRVRGRLGWTSAPQSGGARRFGRKKAHADQTGDAASSARRRGRGAVEIVFWQENVQAYYEMELWGIFYAPDVNAAVVAGRYADNVSFEVEIAR
ncbi:hypothetical protein R80B4_00016 [Fibrobacteres bacterium R8-0-B4]